VEHPNLMPDRCRMLWRREEQQSYPNKRAALLAIIQFPPRTPAGHSQNVRSLPVVARK